MKEIVLDTETTGLSVENGHRIVEIGCIELDDQILTSNRFHCYLNPQRKVSEESLVSTVPVGSTVNPSNNLNLLTPPASQCIPTYFVVED